MAPRGIEFENRLEVFGGDARACASFAYTELTFRYVLRTERDLAKQMDGHRGFWRHFRAALRTSLFATLARIYDESRNTNSAGQFLRFCEGHLELFRRTSRVTRQTTAGVASELAAQRARAAFEPEPGAFAPLFAELDRMRRFYHRSVQPAQARLRRAGYGAADHVDAVGHDELGGAEFAELSVFPLRLHGALEALYHDGRAPTLPDVPVALEAILAGNGTAWEHVRAARNAALFLRSQRFSPSGLDALTLDAGRYREEPSPAFAHAGAGPA
jgi:hypothetical protein